MIMIQVHMLNDMGIYGVESCLVPARKQRWADYCASHEHWAGCCHAGHLPDAKGTSASASAAMPLAPYSSLSGLPSQSFPER